MLLTPVKVLESFSLVAPLGLRFRDVVTGQFVGEGLTVSVYDPVKPTTRFPAFANRSGVYVLHRAPGMRDFENGAGDEEFWNNLPPGREFVVRVTDLERRFQPFQFTAVLPTRGILEWISPIATSPLSPAAGVPLYSSPVRQVPGGMAVVRADLWDAVNDVPAAHAVLEAYSNDQLAARGISDELGRVALIFPQLPPRPFAFGSPPGSPLSSPPVITGPSLLDQEWPLEFNALYAHSEPPPSLIGEFGLEPQLPDLRATLSQPQATLWANAELTEPLGDVSSFYGRELILTSRPSTSPPQPARRSVLFITPAGSPP